jgi:hypothetical protein
LDIIFTNILYAGGGSNSSINDRNVQIDENGLATGCTLTIEANLFVKGDLDYFYESISHEIEHLYQAYLKKKDGSLRLDATSSNEYIRKTNLNQLGQTNVNNKNTYISLLSWLFYLEEHEQDATVNEFFNLLTKNKFTYQSEIIPFYKTTACYKKLQKLKELYKLLNQTITNDNYKLITDWLSYYNINFDVEKTKKLCDYYIQRFEGKIGKVITKYKQDNNMIVTEMNLRPDKEYYEEFKKFFKIKTYLNL